MAAEQYIQDISAPSYNTKEKNSSLEKWIVSATVTDVDDDPPSGFECNICLDFVQDPVVTFCGHLYCWPCIYKWLHMESISVACPDEKPAQCPVCKAEVSETTLVPLYGRGNTTDSSDYKMSNQDLFIPQRPPAPRFWKVLSDLSSSGRLRSEQLRNGNYIPMRQPYFDSHSSYPHSSILGHPLIGMVGELIHGRGFRSSSTNAYNVSSSNYLAAEEDNNPRVRRHNAQSDKSLNRICSFLLCCLLLCLIFF